MDGAEAVPRRGRVRPVRLGEAGCRAPPTLASSSIAATSRTAQTADRFFDPSVNPEIWLRSDDATIYTSQAAAQGYATIRYHRDDGDYGDPTSDDYNDFWGLHLWGDAIDPAEGTDWTAPKKPTGEDDYGIYWNVQLQDATAAAQLHHPSRRRQGPRDPTSRTSRGQRHGVDPVRRRDDLRAAWRSRERRHDPLPPRRR